MESSKDAARQHVRQVRDYYSHLFAYVVINAFLIAVNLLTTPGTLWFYWVSIAWGIGLAFHTYDTFFKRRFFGADWEERKVRQYMRKHPEEKTGEEEHGEGKPA